MESGSQYVSKLNEYAQKQRLKPPEYEDLGSSGPDHMKTFTQRVRLNGQVFPEGVGNTKKRARHDAAKKAFEILMRTEEPAAVCSSKPTETPDKDVSHATGQSTSEDELCNTTSELSVSTQDYSFTETPDYVSLINTYCQKKKYSPNYIEVSREGPSHNYEFTYKLEINNIHYPVGKGKTAKEAQKKAAQLAWSALEKQSDWDSKVSFGSEVLEDYSSTTPSTTQESEVSFQRMQTSSGSDWIQFKDSSKTSKAQVTSNAQDAVQEKNYENGVTTTLKQSRFKSEYDCIEPLGKGSYGYVYKARKKALNKYYAVKEIQSKDIEKSLQEVKVLSDLHHPNIVRYFTFWFEDTGFTCSNFKWLYIEMELCDKGTLRRWINERNKESLEKTRQKESLKLAQQILSGVVYIHSKKLIHRDLKPANILFGQDGHVRIGDFGLATQDNDEGDILERTVDKGTPYYMAPEQVGANYDRKVDIFALGLIFFELFWRLATGHGRYVIWKDVRSQNLPQEFTVAYSLESCIIKSMLSEKPEDRPEASALESNLEKWSKTPEWDTDQRNQTF